MEKYKEEYQQRQIQRIKDLCFFENESRKILNKLIPIYLKVLKPYVNEKILKSGGNEFLKKLKSELNLIQEEFKDLKPIPLKINDYADLTFYLKINYSHISLNVRLSFNGGKYEDKTYYCEYYDKSFYIGNIENQDLKALEDFKEYEQININNQIQIYKNAIALKNEYERELNKFSLYSLSDLVRK